MAIPTYAVQAHGGKIISVDDQSVVKDLAALAGTGGNAYAPYMISGVVSPREVGGYARLRRLVQRVPHDGAVTVKVTPLRDGQDTGQIITRALATGDNPTVVAPLAVTGSTFQFKVELSSFDAAASVGAGEFLLLEHRTAR